MDKNIGLSRRMILKSIAGTSVAVGATGSRSANKGAVPEDEHLYIVLAGGSGLRDRIQRSGFDVLHELANESLFIVQGPEDRRDKLRTMAVVNDVIPDTTYAVNDMEKVADNSTITEKPSYETQWDKQLMETATAHNHATGNGTTVAIIDTGISHTHSALASQINTDHSRLFRYGRMYSGVDDVLVAKEPPGFFPEVTTITQPVAGDVSGHGTSVAGITASARNDTGIVGIAPDAEIISLRSMFWEQLNEYRNTLVGTITDTLLAIDYAVELGVDVINLSLGQKQPSDSRIFTAYRRVIQHAIEQDTVVVAAAENYGVDLDQETDYVLPADIPGAITVAATGPSDRRSHYSNYGNGTVDVAAPGGGYETTEKTAISDPEIVEFPYPTNNVLSTVSQDIYGSQYDYVNGTSIAAPQVAGLACLIRELDPNIHPRRVQQAIEKGAVELSGEYTSGLGAGRINASDTLERVVR
ncbi:S8 family peptidase [Haloterrigena salifodinae]|uniref:S8 family peptidase n=1 Tax=Haloterrigena salifodinae TaxID=2675099 RepID=UPI000F88A770|nr:S8 family serine peptidase [Haloterrigena salifodinae]